MGDSDDTKTEKSVDDKSLEKSKTDEGSKDADSEKVTMEKQKTQEPPAAEEIKENVGDNKTETIMSSQSLKSSNPSISIPNEQVTSPLISTSLKNVKEKHLNRNQSDILPSLRELPRDEDPSLMIFSTKGLPTKKYFRRRKVNSTILPFGFNEKNGAGVQPSTRIKVEAELTPKISQTVPRNAKLAEDAKKMPFSDRNPNLPTSSASRNVLTGFGVSSQVEFKSKSMRRKDGNPVLGEGYEEPVVATNIGRVPPGGYSSGLW